MKAGVRMGEHKVKRAARVHVHHRLTLHPTKGGSGRHNIVLNKDSV